VQRDTVDRIASLSQALCGKRLRYRELVAQGKSEVLTEKGSDQSGQYGYRCYTNYAYHPARGSGFLFGNESFNGFQVLFSWYVLKVGFQSSHL